MEEVVEEVTEGIQVVEEVAEAVEVAETVSSVGSLAIGPENVLVVEAVVVVAVAILLEMVILEGVGAAMTRVELIGMAIGQVVVTAAEAQEAMGRRDAQKTVTRTVVVAVVVVVTVTVVEVHHVMKVAPETALVLMIAPVVAAVPPMIEWVVDLAALGALFLVTLH